MKKVTLLCGMLLALTAAVASAAPGTNLRWNECLGDGGPINRNFACNVNTGTNVLIGSMQVGSSIIGASGNEIVIDFAAASPVLPAWWQMRNVGTCRSTSLSMQFAPTVNAVNCIDWGAGQAGGGIGAYNLGTVEGGPNTARLVSATAVPATALADLFPGQEYYVCTVAVNNLKTVGTGACAGCNVPVCIVYNSNKVTTQVAANDRIIHGATNGTDSNYATWQGGVGVTSGRGIGCPAATPTKNATWGRVKSLYR